MWAIIVSFPVALLSGMGMGSAGLLVLYLTAVEGLSQLSAQGVNLAFFLFSSGSALLVHLLKTPLPYWYILWLIPGGLCGSFFGSALAHALPEALLRRLFGYFLIITASLSLLRKKG